MARAPLSVYALTAAGVSTTQTAPNGSGTGNGNTYSNDGRTVVVIVNTGAATATVTVPANTNTIDGVGVADHTQLVTTNPSVTYVWVPPQWYATAGVTSIDISATTGIVWSAVSVNSF